MAERAKIKRTKPAVHDSPYPPAFVDFMMQHWKPASTKMPPKIRGAIRFEARREALSKAFPGDVLVIPTGHEQIRANDTHYLFRAGSDFYYLTGNLEPDCVLVLKPLPQGGHSHVLYVEPNPGRSEPTFFTDRFKGELWVGPRLGVEQSKHRYQMHEAEPLSELKEYLEHCKPSGRGVVRVLRGLSPWVEQVLGPASEHDKVLAAVLSEKRLFKDSMEVAALKRACASTRRGFEDVIKVLKNAKSEREIEAAFYSRSRIEGNCVGYNVIAASGPHACVLHWNHNDGLLSKRDMVLVDAGVESHELYTADVTRTLPVTGSFSEAQREVYDLVCESQAAGLAEVKPGNDFMAPNAACMRVLAQGLIDMGVLKMSLDEALDPECVYYKRYTLHNVSHMLGLDVHDCAHARQQTYKYGTLKAGMVLTVEPGLYFQDDDLTDPARYRGMGVRIEDDVLVTGRGYEILSDIPRTSIDVERWMQRVWRQTT
jgi:Xaa-Pro aminopeptidase